VHIDPHTQTTVHRNQDQQLETFRVIVSPLFNLLPQPFPVPFDLFLDTGIVHYLGGFEGIAEEIAARTIHPSDLGIRKYA
jgi:hypothetical protein